MKRSELKKILKPLVHECIKESLLEDGLISGIISEVAKGLTEPQTIVEAAPTTTDPIKSRMQRNAFNKDQTNKLHEHKKKLRAAIGGGSYNGVDLFEGTTPAPGETGVQQQGNPLADHAPNDAGVDISNLFGAVGSSWNAHMTDVKEDR